MKRVVTFLLAAGLTLSVAAPASAAPVSSDPTTAARAAAAWITKQVNASGFIPLPADAATPNLSVTLQAVTALASAGVGKAQVDALMGYLADHVEDVVVVGPNDDPGRLGYLILAVEAAGANPASFGPTHVDLVARLVATQQPSGLFGASDATFDGTFRQGLALLALHAVGVTNPVGVTWLEAQQCADGAFVSLRTDLSVPCPAVDPVNFVGADTNSTASAVLGLSAQGATAPAAAGVQALDAVRNAGGGWGFWSSSDQPTDGNSTGTVLTTLRTVNGATDVQGVNALLALQAGCGAPAANRGGIAFLAGAGGTVVPDAFATVQATPALAGVALPIISPSISASVPAFCAAAVTTTTTVAPSTSTTVAATGSTVPLTPTTVAATASTELPMTGGSSAPLAVVAVVVLAVGLVLLRGSRRRA